MASWYGPGFHGNQTASGEIYDMNQLTAAHQTLPLGSIAVVRSLTNGRTVTVRINDRGPFARGRVLDLSFAGARALEMVGVGTDKVELRVVAFRGREGALRVQVGSFSELDRARAMLVQLEISHYNARIVRSNGAGGALYRVQVGYYQTEEQAQAAARSLGKLFRIDPLIVREDGL
ncbi:lipoprotein, RlpA family [Nitrospira sp.]|nr:lipoprotein, RlpA family [Nitrospira sp.]